MNNVINCIAILPYCCMRKFSQLASTFIEHMQRRMIKHQDKLIQGILASPKNEKFIGSKMLAAVDADYNIQHFASR